jgi:hypothetical protein
MKPRKIIGVAIPLLLFGSFALMFAHWVQRVNRPPEIAEGVQSVDWLPAEATDISYCRSYGFTAFEFKISEAGFREWAATAAYQSRESVKFLPITEISELTEDRIFPSNATTATGRRVGPFPQGSTTTSIAGPRPSTSRTDCGVRCGAAARADTRSATIETQAPLTGSRTRDSALNLQPGAHGREGKVEPVSSGLTSEIRILILHSGSASGSGSPYLCVGQ